MSELQVKSIVEPTLTDVLINLKRDIFSTMNCIKIGQINSFDVNKKTAQVQLLFKRVLPDGTTQSLPLLVDVPVLTPQGGGGALQFPIASGDQCLVLFSDRRIDEWLQNGTEAAPGDGRLHDMSDAIAIVGLNALNSSLPVYPTDKVVLSYKNSQFQLTSTGWAFIGEGGAEIDLSGDNVILKTGNSEIDLIAAIVTIKNGATTLLTLINGFITVLEALTVADDEGGAILPLTAASIAALEAYKAQFATLLG